MTLAYIRGVRVVVHPLLPLCLLFAWWLGYGSALLVMAVCLLGHELAHLFAARALGLDIERFEILPSGGVTTFRGYIELSPKAEFGVALAGPLFNLFCCMALIVAQSLTRGSVEAFAPWVQANLVLALMNLVPALPLDGGRALRALLARALGLTRATRLAALLGVLLGAAVIGFALWLLSAGEPLNLTLLLFGATVVYAACKEWRQLPYLLVRDITHKHALLDRERAMRVRVFAVRGEETLTDAVRYFVPQRYHIALILDDAFQTQAVAEEGALVRLYLQGRGGERMGNLFPKEERNAKKSPYATAQSTIFMAQSGSDTIDFS